MSDNIGIENINSDIDPLSQKTIEFVSPSRNMELETVPTNADSLSEEDEQDDEVWGRLFPAGTSFSDFALVKEEYLFGRGEHCDYVFNTKAMMKQKCFQAYSKVHFKIIRETTSTGVHVFLMDMSSNGTFVNGEKVGKGNKQVLRNNDEIALALKRNRAFVYMDSTTDEDANLPQELKERYTLSKLLGRGACGEVKLAFAKGSCKKYAVKIVAKKKFSTVGKNQKNLNNSVMVEVNIMKGLKHPCIIAIEDVVDTPDVLYIVLELVEGGELFDRVVDNDKLEEPLAKLFFYQMVQAVKYLHDRDITHRDLKPENILLRDDEAETLVKVTDFGLSKFVDENTMMKTFCGTPNYLAPEVLLTAGSGSYSRAIDAWSLGVILFIMLAGYPPFSDDRQDTDLELAKQITGGHYDFPNEYWKGISEDAKDLVKKLMTVDPSKRISMADALQHPWLKDDAMISKANKIMFPQADGMIPPSSLPMKSAGKRKADDKGDAPSNKIPA